MGWGNVLGGAGAGAAIRTVLMPGVGTVVGGTLGGGAGLGGLKGTNPKDWSNPFRPYRAKGYDIDPNAFVDPYAAQTRDRAVGQIGGAMGRQEGYAGDQRALVDALMAQSRGEGPSLAQMQLREATDRNMAQSAALMAAQRGVNPALAARNVGYQQAGMAQQMAGQSGQLRLQEQMAAQAALANALGSFRGQDIGLQQFYEGANFQQNQADRAAQIAEEEMRLREALGRQGINAGAQASANAGQLGLLGGVLGGAGSIGAAFAGKAPAGGAG